MRVQVLLQCALNNSSDQTHINCFLMWLAYAVVAMGRLKKESKTLRPLLEFKEHMRLRFGLAAQVLPNIISMSYRMILTYSTKATIKAQKLIKAYLFKNNNINEG